MHQPWSAGFHGLTSVMGRGTLSGVMTASPYRRHWSLAPDLVFLNHGSFGACPTAVLERQAELRREMESSPVEFLHRRYDERMGVARAAVAGLLKCPAGDLVPVTNATTAVNAVAKSWRLEAGDEILTTSFDYNACRNVLHEVARLAGAQVVVAELPFPLDSAERVMDAVLRSVTPRTRFAMIDHVTSNSALVLPVERLVAELEGRGIGVLVDGAHAPGMLPLDLPSLGASWYCGNLHKWVCAPKGCAFLWVRPDRQDDIRPAVTSHGENSSRAGFSKFQDRFDWWGTHDPTAWFCAGDAIRLLDRMLPGGWEEIRRHNQEMALEARSLLCAGLGVEAPCPEDMLGSMATIPLPGRFQREDAAEWPPPQQARLYREFRIEVPFVRVNGQRCFRVSAHLHNTAEDYARLLEALAGM